MWLWEMRLSTCIYTVGDGSVYIQETTEEGQYLPEGSGLTAKNRFIYSDTASVDIFKLNSTSGIDYTEAVIVDRSEPKNARLMLDKDGWFTSIHIVIPKKDWVYKELDKQGSIIYTYDVVYFTDGDSIYTCTKGIIENSSIMEMINETRTNTTISRVDSDYVSIKYLNDKSDQLYMRLFEARMYNGGCRIDACEANRLNSVINLIKHYVRLGQLAEAERVIEKANFFKPVDKSAFDQNTLSLNNRCNC